MGKLDSFHRGQIIQSKVLELIKANEFIVELNGHLLRVSNKSNVSLSVGQKVRLVVSSVNPLSFQLVGASSGHLDVSV